VFDLLGIRRWRKRREKKHSAEAQVAAERVRVLEKIQETMSKYGKRLNELDKTLRKTDLANPGEIAAMSGGVLKYTSLGPVVSVTRYICTVCSTFYMDKVCADLCCDEEKLKVKKVYDGKS